MLKDKFEQLCTALFTHEFIPSVNASFIEEFIFFGTIGLVTIYVTTKKPEDEELRNRIRSVTNANSISDNAKSYFENKSREILAYNKQTIVTVRLKEFREDEKAIRVSIDFDNTISNMCKDVPYTNFSSTAIVKPALKVDNSWGHVTLLTIEDKKNSSQKQVVVEGDVVLLEEEGYYWSNNFQIAADSEARFRLCYEFWTEIQEDESAIAVDKNWIFTVVSRYTDNFTYNIVNKIDKFENIACVISYPTHKNDESPKFAKRDVAISFNETQNIVNEISLYPQDRFKIFIKFPLKTSQPLNVLQGEEDEQA
ncbi:hypothetical protein K9F62_11025 [Desulfovibrio sp. JY]|nr:hypothetical protein K9F62_11025 [Desulfovibrio sp. JY]